LQHRRSDDLVPGKENNNDYQECRSQKYRENKEDCKFYNMHFIIFMNY
jgi:hypothetical protein